MWQDTRCRLHVRHLRRSRTHSCVKALTLREQGVTCDGVLVRFSCPQAPMGAQLQPDCDGELAKHTRLVCGSQAVLGTPAV